MKLSVLVPAYNEESTIEKVLKKLCELKDVFEVIVVDDNSSDKTKHVSSNFPDKRIKVVSHDTNQGKGAAVRTALSQARGDYILIQDADLEYDPKDIPVLIKPVIDGRIQVVYGSRFIGARTNMFYWHYLGNIFLNWIVNILYNSILSDMETGYKLIPTKMMKELNLAANDFRIEPEITCKLLKRKVKIMEVPITYIGRTYEEGKKITWKDGFKALETILAIRFK